MKSFVSLPKLLLYLLLALACATLQHRLRDTLTAYPGNRYGTEKIAEFRSKTPIQRRILVPWAAVELRDRAHVPLPQVELAIRTAALTGVLIALDLFLAGLGWGTVSLVGPLVLVCLLPLGFYVNPVLDSYPAMLVMISGLLCIQRKREVWLPIVIFLGTFVRETTLLLPLVYAFAGPRQSLGARFWPTLGMQLLAYALARAVLEWAFPGPSWDATLGFNVRWLMEAGMLEALLRLLLLVLPFALAICGFHRTQGLARAMLVVGCAYGGLLLFVGRLSEPRIFWDAYLLLVPALVATLVGTTVKVDSAGPVVSGGRASGGARSEA